MRSQNGLLLLLLAALIFVIPCQAVSTSTTLRAATTTTLANAPAQSTTVFCPSQGTYGPDFLHPFSYHEPKTNQKKIASFNCLRLSSPMRRLSQSYGAEVPLLIFNPDNKCFIVRMPRTTCLMELKRVFLEQISNFPPFRGQPTAGTSPFVVATYFQVSFARATHYPEDSPSVRGS